MVTPNKNVTPNEMRSTRLFETTRVTFLTRCVPLNPRTFCVSVFLLSPHPETKLDFFQPYNHVKKDTLLYWTKGHRCTVDRRHANHSESKGDPFRRPSGPSRSAEVCKVGVDVGYTRNDRETWFKTFGRRTSSLHERDEDTL